MVSDKLYPGALLESYSEFWERNAYYVDKTMFIEEVLNNPNKVQLYTRPRRFGKTLALSALKTFLEKKYDRQGNVIDPRKWFEGKKIMACGDRILSNMAQSPVISLTLKDCTGKTFEKSLEAYKFVLRSCLIAHEKEITSCLTDEEDLAIYKRFRNRKASVEELELSLKMMSEWLFKATGVKPYILIDEYDVPLQGAYLHHYYDEMVSFVRALFSNGMKTNDDNFEKAILTGCLRVSKESVFTGFNNLEVYSIASKMRCEYFGFTATEVKEMLAYYELSEHYEAVKAWYDSYLFGDQLVYNPYSLAQCVGNLTLKDERAIRCYWTNTSGNDIIRDLVLKHPECRSELEALLRGETIHKPIYETITYRDLDAYDQNIWTFLYYTGYIKSLSYKVIDHEWIHELALVNQEIRSIFPQYIKILFNQTLMNQDLPSFLDAFWKCDAEAVKQFINRILQSIVSYHDTQEMFYHGMLVGIFSSLLNIEVKSNREEGNGRTDIVIRDKYHFRALVLEFKWSDEFAQITKLPAVAMKQIKTKKYAETLRAEGFRTVFGAGLGFCGKQCEAVVEEL